jgi:hypothetical protein
MVNGFTIYPCLENSRLSTGFMDELSFAENSTCP